MGAANCVLFCILHTYLSDPIIMSKTKLFAALLLLSGAFAAQAQEQPAFLSHPTLSPDAKTVVFSYEGDLWQVPADGGQALRLTAMDGHETAPRVSPDGKWLAFSATLNGNMDVFVMPLAGGDIKQITHHDGQDDVASWSWDSKSIYFTSSRYNRFSSYKVSKDGGTAKRLFPHYFNYIHGVVETPSGELLFNDSWESYSSANRKRYKGAFNPDVLGFDPKTNTYKSYTDYEGKDFWQTVDRNGKVFFVSDEGNDEYNLYTFANDKKVPLTTFKESIKRPIVSADGSRVVFEKDYQLYTYDVASKQSKQIPISLNRNQVLGKQSEWTIGTNISTFEASPDGKKLAFVVRGELFVSDIEGKFVRQMSPAGERVGEVKWLKDSKTLLYSQTHKGYLNWYSRAADGSGESKQLTSDLRSNRELAFNKDKTKGVYLSGRDEVRLLDLATLKSETIVKDEIWAFQNSSPSFSPDGKYVLFTAIRNFEQDIFVHEIATKKTTNLTNTGVTESAPVWSPDGKYIYFASNRTKPSYPMGMQDASIFRMALEQFDTPYRKSKFDALFDDAKKDSTSTKDDKTAKNAKDAKDKATKSADAKDKVVVTIDFDGLLERIERVSPNSGTQYSPVVIAKGDKTYTFYYSNHEGKGAMYRTVTEPFAAAKTDKVADGWAVALQEVGGKYYALSGGVIQKYNLESNKLDKITISHKFTRNLADEFSQMFYETWAGVEENFYDNTFHGLDWTATKAKYEKYLPLVNSRMDLRILLNDMLGELNSSHLGFSSPGAEERKSFNFVTNEIGVIFNQDKPYEVAEIVKNTMASRKGVDLKVGDVITAVNAVKVDPAMDRDYYFMAPSLLEEMQLTVSRGGKELQVDIRPQSSSSFKDELHNTWVRNNRAKVDAMSNNRIAYSHMKNMGGSELERFLIDMAEQEINKDAIILDLRYNTGGNVHDEVLRFLSQRPYLHWQYRGGKRAPQGHFAPSGKPIVLLINEQSLSDAEMTAAGFKALKLGKIIGTETYRWIIFTSSKGLVDGSNYRVPAWGCYTLEGDNLELTGVAPDIYVKNTVADKAADRDPQLERAIQEILNDLK